MAQQRPDTRPDLARRLSYFMLLRVGVTTVVLLGAAVSELLAAPEVLGATATTSPALPFVLIGGTYGLALVWTLLMRRGHDVATLAAGQVATDVASVTLVVHVSGGAESGFVFLYLLAIVGASTVLSARGLLAATVGMIGAYLAVAVGGRLGWLSSWPLHAVVEGPLRPVLRVMAINLVAFAATAALARRLTTELERAGARIAAQSHRLEDLTALHADVLRSLTSGLITADLEGRVITINEAAAEILGLPRARAGVLQLAELLPGLPRLDEGEALRRAELRLVRPDGQPRVVGVSLSPLVTVHGVPVGRMVNFQDLTELQRMREQVERSERLAAIGRLAASVAHEIRNPLAAISGAAEMLRISSGAVDAELTDIVSRESDRLNRLITDMLEFARPREPETTTLELATVVQEFAVVFAKDPRAVGAPLELHLDEDLWIEADPGQLRQVLWNLVRNAVEASPPGTAIGIAARQAASDGSGGGGDGEREVEIAVRDHGPGFSTEQRARLFEPFFSTKQGGTGLGLATVHRIVEAHHGKIRIDAPDGGGAEMVIRLPRCAPPVEVLASLATPRVNVS